MEFGCRISDAKATTVAAIRPGVDLWNNYVAVNDSLNEVASKLDVDLWTLDSLWWLTELEHEPEKHQFAGGEGSGSGSSSSRRAKVRSTFVCSNCFLTKSTSLRSSDPAECLDCNPKN